MRSRALPPKLTRTLLAATAAVAVAALAVPQSAYAWWRPHAGIGISIPLVVPGPPVYYPPPPPAYAYYGPPPVYYRPPPRRWIPPHRNWAGAWIPGHWIYR